MKFIPGYENKYSATKCGKIFSEKYGIYLSPQIGNAGYERVNLYCPKTSKRKTYSVHRLIALTYLGYSELTVNHKNGIKTDNRVENLEYVTQSQNNIHAVKNKLSPSGETHYKSKLKLDEIYEIRKSKMHPNDLAKIYGVTRGHIINIQLKNCWKHL